MITWRKVYRFVWKDSEERTIAILPALRNIFVAQLHNRQERHTTFRSLLLRKGSPGRSACNPLPLGAWSITDCGLPLELYFPTIHVWCYLLTVQPAILPMPIVLISANISYSTLVGTTEIRPPCVVAILESRVDRGSRVE